MSRRSSDGSDEEIGRISRDRGQVMVRVDDDGPGMPPENLETVFERFYTSRPRGAAFGGNSGLGLSIARQIIEAHGGKVHAENRQDETGAVVGVREAPARERADRHRRPAVREQRKRAVGRNG